MADKKTPRKETVTEVIDGDTIRTSGRKDPIRIQGIDTPERGQPGFEAAKRALAKLVEGEQVIVTPVARDTFGRTVAKVKKGSTLIPTLMKKHQKKK